MCEVVLWTFCRRHTVHRNIGKRTRNFSHVTNAKCGCRIIIDDDDDDDDDDNNNNNNNDNDNNTLLILGLVHDPSPFYQTINIKLPLWYPHIN
jgi:hypothetical protein